MELHQLLALQTNLPQTVVVYGPLKNSGFNILENHTKANINSTKSIALWMAKDTMSQERRIQVTKLQKSLLLTKGCLVPWGAGRVTSTFTFGRSWRKEERQSTVKSVIIMLLKLLITRGMSMKSSVMHTCSQMVEISLCDRTKDLVTEMWIKPSGILNLKVLKLVRLLVHHLQSQNHFLNLLQRM